MELDEERQNGDLLMERIDRGREQVNVSHNTLFFLEWFRCLTRLKELKQQTVVS